MAGVCWSSASCGRSWLNSSRKPLNRRCWAARLPPNPDPGYLLLLEAERTLRQATKQCRVPELATAIRTLADQAHALVASWQKEITHADAQ